MRQDDFYNRTYTILMIELVPFFFVNSSGQNNGFCVELMNIITQRLNISYEIKKPPDNKYGIFDDRTGEWNGMMKMILDNEGDIISGAFTVTSERSQYIDFTVPFYGFAGITILMKKEKSINGLFSFLSIYEWNVWCLIIATIILVGILLYIFDTFNSFNPPLVDWKKMFTIQTIPFKEFIWKIFGVFAQGHLAGVNEKAHRCFTTKIILFGLYMFCFICIIFYQANLAVFLTVSKLTTPINSLSDLVEKNVKYNLVGSTSTQVFFEDMKRIEEDFFEYWIQASLNEKKNPIESEIFWEYPLNNIYTILDKNMKIDGYLNTTEEGIQRVLDSSSSEKFAFITEYPSALYTVKKYCNMEIVGKQFSNRPYSFGVKKNSWLKNALNDQILRLQREGIISKLKTKWWNYESSNCKEQTDSQINMQSIGGLFIFIGFCVALLTISMFLEFLILIKKF